MLGDFLAGWPGGIDFLRFSISALNSVTPQTSWSVLIQSESIRKTLAVLVKNGLKTLAGRKTRLLAGVHRSDLIYGLRGYGLGIDVIDYRNTVSGLADAMRRCHAEALFPCDTSLGRSFPLPWIGYIPDLQHKRLPHWFSEEDRG
jgi:hypothetical protein